MPQSTVGQYIDTSARDEVPLDTEAIRETIAAILEIRSGIPSRDTSERWRDRLRGHLGVLSATVTRRIEAEPYKGTPYAELVVLAVDFIRTKLKMPLPGDPELAHGAVRDLARQCRTLLGLATDELEAGR